VEKYIASCNNSEEIKQKLENLILESLKRNQQVYPFGDYFSEENFKQKIEQILND
jgi:hypothetical protein